MVKQGENAMNARGLKRSECVFGRHAATNVKVLLLSRRIMTVPMATCLTLHGAELTT